MQWERARVAAADIEHENHVMGLVFGNEMADAVAKQAASEAALRGAVAEQVSWVDALAWQVQRRIIEANLQASKTTPIVSISLRRVSGGHSTKPSCSQSTHQFAFRRSRQRWECQVWKQNMCETSLVRRLKVGPCASEIQTMQSIGSSLGLGVQQTRAGACIHPNWVENSASFACSGPTSKHYVVLELCGMDFSIFMQIEHAMFGRDQGVGARRFEQDQTEIPATCKNELAVTSDGVQRAVKMASNSASERGSFELMRLPNFVVRESLQDVLRFSSS